MKGFWLKEKCFGLLWKVYDSIDIDYLWNVLYLYGQGGRLLSDVKSFYVKSRACIRV